MAGHPGPAGTAYLAGIVPAAAFAEHTRALLDEWARHPDVPGALLGPAIACAAQAHDDARRSPHVELVVSGPSSRSVRARRTEQVLMQIASEARTEILVVTYAIYIHPDLRRLLTQAVSEHVTVTFLAETQTDNPGFRGDPAPTIADIGATLLRWPRTERPEGGAAMHAKLVLIDRTVAFLSSANLTERAADDNLEAGVLVRGGDIPGRLADHFDDLRRQGILVVARDATLTRFVGR
jgi:phosphatidylserine/phosphatidylglycerophosphate/cardiolipin synthase-like enzyme